MATYAQVVNDNGTISIDDTTARLIKTRTVNLTTSETEPTWPSSHFGIANQYAVGKISRTKVTLQDNEKLVAIRATKPHNNVAFFGRRTGSNIAYIYAVSNLANKNLYRADYKLDVYGYVPTTSSSHGAGLQIYNASGNLIFDSNYHIMNVNADYKHDHSTNYSATDFGPHKVNISGYSYEDNSVVINSSMSAICLQSDAAGIIYCTYGYGFVFSESTGAIYLEHRIGVGDRGTNMPSYNSISLWPAGVCLQTSALFLNSKNIS